MSRLTTDKIAMIKKDPDFSGQLVKQSHPLFPLLTDETLVLKRWQMHRKEKNPVTVDWPTMKNQEETAIRVIADILTDGKYSEKTRLNVLRGFKLTLNKSVPTLETKLINACDIECFLDSIASTDCEENSSDNGFQIRYFSFLLSLICARPELHGKIRLELARLVKKKVTHDSLVTDLWTVLEENSLFWPEVIQEVLPWSKLILEEKIFEWVTMFTISNINLQDLNIKYYTQLSVHCCEIFKMIITILNEFVILTHGNEKVLQLVHYFTLLVAQNCDEHGKAIFTLYPRRLNYIISLLHIPPIIFSQETKKGSKVMPYKTKLLKLLLHAFKDDQDHILLMLTHYPKWLTEFATYTMTDDNI